MTNPILEEHVIFKSVIGEDGIPRGVEVAREWVEAPPQPDTTQVLIEELKNLSMTEAQKTELALILLERLKTQT
jgi:hypothetical protein